MNVLSITVANSRSQGTFTTIKVDSIQHTWPNSGKHSERIAAYGNIDECVREQASPQMNFLDPTLATGCTLVSTEESKLTQAVSGTDKSAPRMNIQKRGRRRRTQPPIIQARH
ncbi:unnamed protein product, partial [Iphiclides podalirius]